MSNVIVDVIATRILELRGEKVMLDRDLALLYGVSTKSLNQAVRRNIERFPLDFMFQLTKEEKEKVVTDCDHLRNLRFSYQLPHVFTEQGIAMLSSVLNSEKAIRVNILIMRAFVRLRKVLFVHKDLLFKLSELERKIEKHDLDIRNIFEAIRQLIRLPDEHRKIDGFSKK